jgi:hypothetical protein
MSKGLLRFCRGCRNLQCLVTFWGELHCGYGAAYSQRIDRDSANWKDFPIQIFRKVLTGESNFNLFIHCYINCASSVGSSVDIKDGLIVDDFFIRNAFLRFSTATKSGC